MKVFYEFSEEEIINYLHNNYYLFKYSYEDIKLRICIYNHFGLLEGVIFNNQDYLKSHFPRETIGNSEIYAILMSKNINSIEELKKVFDFIHDEELIVLTRKYPLTDDIKREFESEVMPRVKKELFMLELKRRREFKQQGN